TRERRSVRVSMWRRFVSHRPGRATSPPVGSGLDDAHRGLAALGLDGEQGEPSREEEHLGLARGARLAEPNLLRLGEAGEPPPAVGSPETEDGRAPFPHLETERAAE